MDWLFYTSCVWRTIDGYDYLLKKFQSSTWETSRRLMFPREIEVNSSEDRFSEDDARMMRAWEDIRRGY